MEREVNISEPGQTNSVWIETAYIHNHLSSLH